MKIRLAVKFLLKCNKFLGNYRSWKKTLVQLLFLSVCTVDTAAWEKKADSLSKTSRWNKRWNKFGSNTEIALLIQK